MSQLVSDRKKASYHDYFANKQPAFTNEYYDKKGDDDTKKEISDIKDIVIIELQHRTSRPSPFMEEKKGEDVIELIGSALEDPDKLRKLENLVPAVKLVKDRLVRSEKNLELAEKQIEFVETNKKLLDDELSKARIELEQFAKNNKLIKEQNSALYVQYKDVLQKVGLMEKDMKLKERKIKENNDQLARAETLILELDLMAKEKSNSANHSVARLEKYRSQLEAQIETLTKNSKEMKDELTERKKEIKKINMSISKLGELKEQAVMEKEEITTNLNKSRLEAVALNKINELDDISTATMLKKLFKRDGLDNYNGLNKRDLVKLFFSEGFEIVDYVNFSKNPNEGEEEKKDETPKKKDKVLFGQRLPMSSAKKEYEKRRQRKIKENRAK